MVINPIRSSAFGALDSVSVRRRGRTSLIGLSLTGIMLAGTALVPAVANAQVYDITVQNGGTLSVITPAPLVGFNEVTNGQLNLRPNAASSPLTFNLSLTDSLGVLSVSKLGVNTVVLTGTNNTYSGNTAFNAGLVVAGAANTLSANSRLSIGNTGRFDLGGFGQIVNGLASGVGGQILNESPNAVTLTIQGANNTIYNGAIAETQGAVSIVKNGSSTQSFTNAANSFSGGVTLNSGILRYGADGSLGTGTLTVGQAGARIIALTAGDALGNDVLLNAGVEVSAGAMTTRWSGVVSGTGDITKIASGTLVLSNSANDFSGDIIVQNGRLSAGGDNVFGTGDIRFEVSNAQMGTDGDISAIVSNDIILQTGANVDAPGAGNTLTLSGDISGPNGIFLRTPLGGGTLLLTGDNSFAGGVSVESGNVSIGSNTALGTGGAVFAPGSGSLQVVDNLVVDNEVSLGKVTDIDTGDFSLTLNGRLRNQTGQAGGIRKIGDGTLILTGASTYTAGTVVDTGELQLDGSVAGDVTVNAATLSGGGSIGGNLITNAGSIVSPGNSPGTLTVGGNFTIGAGTTLVFELADPNVVGGGVNDLIDVGGNLTLGGQINVIPLSGFQFGTFTIINYAGLLDETNPLALGVIPSDITATVITAVPGAILLDLAFSGVVQYWDGSGPANNGNVEGGAGVWNDVLTNWTNIGGTTNLPWADVTAIFAGDTGDAVTVAGPKDVTGLVFETDGYTLSGDVINFTVAPSISVAPSITAVVNNVLTGAGDLTKSGDGNLVLGGVNTYTGDTLLTAGTLTVTNDDAFSAGNVLISADTTLAAGAGVTLANNVETLGNGLVASNGFTFILNGDVTGAGSISHVTLGNLVLNGNNSFTGLGINAGTVTLGTDSAGGLGEITINDLATLAAGANNLNIVNSIETTARGIIDTGAFNLTVSGLIGNVGSITKAGSGTLTLTRNNTYAGGTTILAGTLVGNSLTFGPGNIANAGSLVLNQMSDATFAQSISGIGSVTKQGAGQLLLSGISTYTGATSVSAGELRVTGSIAGSTVTVGSGSTLSGSGTVGGLIVQSGATAAPGNSAVGTLAVAGLVTFQPGSTYVAQVTTTTADRITALGAASLAGTLAVSVAPGSYNVGTAYTVLSASSITGTFTTVTGLSGFGTGTGFQLLVSYGGGLVRIALAPNSLVATGGTSLSGNPLAVARAFDRAVNAGYNPSPFFDLYTQGTNLQTALSQLSGEVHSAERRVAMEDTRVIRETAFDRLNAGMASLGNTQAATTSNGDAETTFWLRGVGSWGVAQGDAVGSRFTTEQIGVLTGVDYAKNGFKIGAGFTYTQNDIEFASLGTSRVKSTGGVIYAGYRSAGGLSVALGGSLAGTRSNSNRAITVTGLSQTLRGSVDGRTYQLFGELAYDLAASERTQISPFARYAYVSTRANAFGETGGIAAVNGVRQTYDISVVQAGLRAGFDIGNGNAIVGSAAWQSVTGDRVPLANLGITGLNQVAGISAAALDKNSAALEAKVNFRVTEKATLAVGYNGVIGDRNNDHGARATLTVGF